MTALYASGVLLQVLGTLGWTYLVLLAFQNIEGLSQGHTSKFNTSVSNESLLNRSSLSLCHLSTFSFPIAGVLESALISGLAMSHLLNETFLLGWFWGKAGLGIICLFRIRHRLASDVLNHRWLWCWAVLLILHASLPTSNFDCFSAHFPIPNLFIETGGYPIRPDYQYLDALPLSAHMWLIPPFATGFEGGANIISGIYSIAIVLLVIQVWGSRVGFFAFMVCLSMPEFLRVSLDPMVDTPCFFYALTGFAAFRHRHRLSPWLGFVFWVFLVGIKPTCAPFAIFGLVWLIHRVGLKTCFKWSPVLFLLTLPASIWFIKNAWLYGSPLYPYVGGPNIAPLIPSEVLAQLPSRSWSEKLWGYIWVVFADHRYVLSLGFWPLFSLPFLLIKKHNTKILTICVISGLLLTLLMTPFKNRYMMPFLFCYLPTMAILLKKSPLIVRLCLYGTVLFNGISFSPYLAQPLYATIKGWNVDDFYGFKFYNYQAYQNVRNLPKGKILLVGQASHWLKRPHILSVISETHLDYTRLKSIDDLLDFIHANEIRHIVFDWRDVHGMAESTNPWYAKKSYCAQKALLWMKALEQHPHISFQFEQSGVRVMSLKDK